MAGDAENEQLAESQPEAREAEAFLEHARAFWTAEETNAARLASHVRLLTTLSIGLLGIIAYRLTLSLPMELPDFSVLVAAAAMPAAVAIVFLPLSRPQSLWMNDRLPIFGVLALVLLTSIGLQFSEARRVVFSALSGASAGLLISALVLAVVGLVHLFYLRPLKPASGSEAPSGSGARSAGDTEAGGAEGRSLTATLHFSLSRSAIRRADEVMLPAEWSVFRRRYQAAVDLRERNNALRDRIRRSQKLMTRSFLVGLVMLLTWLAAALVESL
ncbi:MAG: hypothetical protein JJU33_14795 [Phycisphaerales bacterium]|nr:hypothetical protein [Phycisphaerales bacterium]